MRLPLTLGGGETPLHVYAARSRRSGGVVLGIDLSQARCNWRCVYCEVDGLERGEGPELDVDRVRSEFAAALDAVPSLEGGPASAAELAAVHFSGSGEPTQNYQFPDVVEAVTSVIDERGLKGALNPVLVTNGAKLSDRRVRVGLQRLADFGATAWVKLDSATREGQKDLCDSDLILRHVRNYLKVATEHMPTTLQTCVFQRGGEPSLDAAEREAFVGFIRNQLAARLSIKGVQLYAPDRAARTGEAIGPPDAAWVEELATSLREMLPVDVYL